MKGLVFTRLKSSLHKCLLFCVAPGLLVLGSAAQAAPATLKDTVQKAIDTNPDVLARWHDFQAALDEREVARTGYSPQVDLSLAFGHEQQRFRDGQRQKESYNRKGISLVLDQMIYDGFATRSEVDRVGYNARARFYDFLDAAEQTALETYRAYEDVLRFRALIQLARDNLTKHEEVASLIAERVDAGVGRSVDLEQVTGRVALAESNLLTETSNLHDVSARFLRVVGEMPPENMNAVSFDQNRLPATLEAGLQRAYIKHPGHLARIQEVFAAEQDVKVQEARLQPRLDFRLVADYGEDIDRIHGDTSDYTGELVLSYNLFSGGARRYSISQKTQQLNMRLDTRDRSCRDTRQLLSIALNDVKRTEQQLKFLNQHEISMAKAREAYREQFDIGQRTLLDLLDSENEYFEARRAYLNGQYDLSIARARALAGMGDLMETLSVTRGKDSKLPTIHEEDTAIESAGACK